LWEPYVMKITTDGGATWASRSLPCKSTIRPGGDLTTLDGREIWQACVGPMASQSPPFGFTAVFVSEDGGVTWSDRPATAPVPYGSLMFPRELVVTGHGSALVAPLGGLIYVTHDAGVTWHQAGPTRADLGSGCGFKWLNFYEPAGAWANGVRCGSPLPAELIWVSHDHGEHWSQLPPLLSS
jgi:hypothetical protein